MTLDFPNNPTDGQQYVAEGEVWTYRNPPGVWAVGGGQGEAVEIVEDNIKTVNGMIVIGDALIQWGNVTTSGAGVGSRVFTHPYDTGVVPTVELTMVADDATRVTLSTTPTETQFDCKTWFANGTAGGPYSVRWTAHGLAPAGMRKPKTVIEGGGIGQLVDVVTDGDQYQVVGKKLICWGRELTAADDTVVTLPTAFKDVNYEVMITNASDITTGVGAYGHAAGQFTLAVESGTPDVSWVAIGDVPDDMALPTRIIGADADSYLRNDLDAQFLFDAPGNRLIDWFDVVGQFTNARLGMYSDADPTQSFWEVAKYGSDDGLFKNNVALYDGHTYFNQGLIVSTTDGASGASFVGKSDVGQLFLSFANSDGNWDWAFRYDIGSLFQLNRYDGAGNYVDTPIYCDYTDGSVDVQTPQYHDLTGAQSWNRTGKTVECWGTAVASAGGGLTTVTFPKVYANPPVVTLGPVACEARLKALPTTTGVDIETLVGGVLADGQIVQWWAVGEWDGVS